MWTWVRFVICAPAPICHSHVHLGNYAEVKKSRLGEGVHMGHFSYLGDARSRRAYQHWRRHDNL